MAFPWNRSFSAAGRHGTAAPEHPIPDDPQPVILITYETSEEAIREALDAIMVDGHIADKPQMIRIEQLG